MKEEVLLGLVPSFHTPPDPNKETGILSGKPDLYSNSDQISKPNLETAIGKDILDQY